MNYIFLNVQNGVTRVMERREQALKSVGIALIVSLFMTSCTTGNSYKLPRTLRSRTKATVIIDAGHGGEDGGAVGSKGLREKDLTLDIALRVKKLMSRVMPNVQVVLTREQDIYVGLEKRISIAHEMKGDVFLSIHINSSEQKDASGFEIYSLDVASDRHSERLAARENKEPGKARVNYILADLRANQNRAESDRLASFITRGLSRQLSRKIAKSNITNRGYNQALFQVLFVKMPAVLAELFFISNPQEEKLLNDQAVRELCARGLVVGLKDFLDKKDERVRHAAKG